MFEARFHSMQQFHSIQFMHMDEPQFTTVESLKLHFYCATIDIESFKAAFNLGLFEYLQSDERSVTEIKKALNLKAVNRNLYDFFDKLVMLGVLEREGIEESALYRNSSSSKLLFLKDSPQNVIAFVNFCGDLQKCFNNLENDLREGSKMLFDEKFFVNKDTAMEYLQSMKQKQDKNFDMTLETLTVLKNCKTSIDIGGALGTLSYKLKTLYPETHCLSLDLPIVTEMAYEFLKSEGFDNKIELIKADFLKDDWPKTDVVFMGNILHDWNFENKMLLLKKSYERLNPGGMLVCIEEFIDNDRESPTPGLYISLVMIVHANGYNMTPREFEYLTKLVGFKKVEYYNQGVEFCVAYK